MRTQLHALFALAAIAAAPGPIAAQGTFTGLGSAPTYVSDISGDGAVVVGQRGTYGTLFRWTAAEGLVNIGGTSLTVRVSRDGRTIVSDALNAQGFSEAAIWVGGRAWMTIGNLGGSPQGENRSVSTSYDVSGDGTIVVGLAWLPSGVSCAFRWDKNTGMVNLGSLQKLSSRANAISADGNVIVGWDQEKYQWSYNPWRGAMWWQGSERLLHFYGWIGQAEGVNHNGTAIVGRGHPDNTRHAYLWTPWGTRDLGALKRGLTPAQQEQEDTSIAYAVNDDATVVVGTSGWMPPLDAFIWTPETNMMKLADYLISKGIKGFEGWTLAQATSVSEDGKVIAGTGLNARGQPEGYLVRLQ